MGFQWFLLVHGGLPTKRHCMCLNDFVGNSQQFDLFVWCQIGTDMNNCIESDWIFVLCELNQVILENVLSHLLYQFVLHSQSCFLVSLHQLTILVAESCLTNNHLTTDCVVICVEHWVKRFHNYFLFSGVNCGSRGATFSLSNTNGNCGSGSELGSTSCVIS